MSSEPTPPRVFIAYGHDSPKQMDRVTALCNRLREDGLDCDLDRFITAPPAGWPMWMELSISRADFVVLVCSKARRERLEREAEREGEMEGSGSDWEIRIITNDIYSSPAHRSKYVPVFFESEDHNSIPLVMRDLSFYDLGGGPGYEQLLGRLVGEPDVERAPRGVLGALEPREPQVPVESPPAEAASVSVGFDDDLLPNEADVYEAAQATREGESVAIDWPQLNDELFELHSARRPTLRSQLEDHGVEQGPGLVQAIEVADISLSEASRRRRQAAGRLPLMWAGMAASDHWGTSVEPEFRQALRNFLVLANLRTLVSMAHARLEGEGGDLPAGLNPSLNFTQQFQLPQLAETFDAKPPFWAADVVIGRESLYVWAPREKAIAVSRRGVGSGGRFLSDFLIPQVEDHLIGRDTLMSYDPGEIRILKIRDEDFQELEPGSF